MLHRRGIYELLLGFFLVFVLLFGVLFFLFLDNQTSGLYAAIKGRTSGFDESENIREVLLACHGVTFLDAAKMDQPCPAKEMGRGFTVIQLPVNGCPERHWSYLQGSYSEKIPFVVTILQEDGAKKCLARLEVLLP
jgi:hypothetical protein